DEVGCLGLLRPFSEAADPAASRPKRGRFEFLCVATGAFVSFFRTKPVPASPSQPAPATHDFSRHPTESLCLPCFRFLGPFHYVLGGQSVVHCYVHHVIRQKRQAEPEAGSRRKGNAAHSRRKGPLYRAQRHPVSRKHVPQKPRDLVRPEAKGNYPHLRTLSARTPSHGTIRR